MAAQSFPCSMKSLPARHVPIMPPAGGTPFALKNCCFGNGISAAFCASAAADASGAKTENERVSRILRRNFGRLTKRRFCYTVVLRYMQFEWDEAKNRANQRKHGVDFDTASRTFDDERFLVSEDWIDETGEQRFEAIGLVNGVLLVTVYVYRSKNNGEEIIRIISARKAGKKESRRYFQ